MPLAVRPTYKVLPYSCLLSLLFCLNDVCCENKGISEAYPLRSRRFPLTSQILKWRGKIESRENPSREREFLSRVSRSSLRPNGRQAVLHSTRAQERDSDCGRDLHRSKTPRQPLHSAAAWAKNRLYWIRERAAGKVTATEDFDKWYLHFIDDKYDSEATTDLDFLYLGQNINGQLWNTAG